MFKIIVCMNKNRVIGYDNKLIYHIKDDLKHFKLLTTNQVVIMGRKTYESLPNGRLPNRINIVITRDVNFYAPECIVVSSIDDAIRICEETYKDKELFVIGGSTIYNEFLTRGVVSQINMTYVYDDANGDTFFPDVINDKNWELVETTDAIFDSVNNVKYEYLILKKNVI